MTHLNGDDRARYVQEMFTQIAPRYDLMNRLMTGGQDVGWRREAIARARLTPGARLLDLGAGTGDLAREACRQQPAAKVVAADLTLAMMQHGEPRHGQAQAALTWSAADARQLPFSDRTFDAVVSGFLMRNVGDVAPVLAEQWRVLKPGGQIVVLDTTRPKRNLLSPFIWMHMHLVIPLVGGLISGFRNAYTYLPDSTENFLAAEDLASRLTAAGFKNVGFRRLMFGTIALHWGEK
jgi:demethylmenaquinone methyltransferase / 2-methoxy-6-polyprenyl-1,4-benzoquinol methylase